MGEAGLAPPIQQTEPGRKRSKRPGSFDRQNEKVKRISPMKGGCGRGRGCADTLTSLDTRADTLNSGSSLIDRGEGGSSHRERNKNQNNGFQTIPFYSMYSARGQRAARDNGDTGTTHTAPQGRDSTAHQTLHGPGLSPQWGVSQPLLCWGPPKPQSESDERGVDQAGWDQLRVITNSWRSAPQSSSLTRPTGQGARPLRHISKAS